MFFGAIKKKTRDEKIIASLKSHDGITQLSNLVISQINSNQMKRFEINFGRKQPFHLLLIQFRIKMFFIIHESFSKA